MLLMYVCVNAHRERNETKLSSISLDYVSLSTYGFSYLRVNVLVNIKVYCKLHVKCSISCTYHYFLNSSTSIELKRDPFAFKKVITSHLNKVGDPNLILDTTPCFTAGKRQITIVKSTKKDKCTPFANCYSSRVRPPIYSQRVYYGYCKRSDSRVQVSNFDPVRKWA